MTEQEVNRIQRVYAGYRADEAVQSQWSDRNPGNRLARRERLDQLYLMLAQHGYLPLGGRKVLDVGCGIGHLLAQFRAWGAAPENLFGVDLLPDRVEAARSAYPDVTFEVANAEHLSFGAEHFDLVLFFTVFTSVLDEDMAQNLAREALRVLKPGGAVIWYDFRFDNPRNANVRGIGRSGVQKLFPDCDIRLHTLTLMPPLARRLGPATPALYPVLTMIPFLRTHYLGLIAKPV